MFDRDLLEKITSAQRQWEENELLDFRHSDSACLYARGSGGCPIRGHRTARPVSVYAWSLSNDVPRPAVDDASDCRLRNRRRHEPAFQIFDRTRPDGPF